jgi:tetratricopeptide (TPR) repeat protein
MHRIGLEPRASDLRHGVALVFAALLAACAATAPRVHGTQPGALPGVAPVAAQDDALLHLLQGQFALQRNDLAGGAQAFTDAALLSTDPALAAEATRLALSVKDWKLARRALVRWQALAPAEPGLVQARAWIALGEGRPEDAFADLDTLASRGDEQGWRLVAQVLLNAQDKAAAARLLERLATPEHLGTRATSWIAVSQLAFKLGDKAAATKLSDSALQRFPVADAYAWSARLAIDRGDKAAARAIFAKGLARVPDDATLRGGYAALLGDAGDNAGAARVLARGPQDEVTYAARAAYAARAKDLAALATLYAQLEADTGARSGKRIYLLGQVAELLEKREAALAWYRAVPEEDERWFDAQTRQAVVLDQLGRTAEAIDFLHRLQAETDADADQLVDAHLLEADLLARHGRVADAMAVYGRGLGIVPDDGRLLYARALLAVDQGDLASGERDLRHLIELKPDNAEALNALGYTLADHSPAGDPRQQEALQLIQRALKLKPDEPAIVDSLGWVQYRLGNLDASLAALRRAYAKQPDADVAAHLGEVLWMHGEHEEARRVWDEGKRKDAKNKALLDTIRRLAT